MLKVAVLQEPCARVPVPIKMGEHDAEINWKSNFLVPAGSFDGCLFGQCHAREKRGREKRTHQEDRDRQFGGHVAEPGASDAGSAASGWTSGWERKSST